MSTRQLESTLYAPVRDWLVSAGWTVHAEVKDCDIAARRDDDLAIVELKRNVGVRLLEQALDRLRITPNVYVAVPCSALPARRRARARLFRLLRRLELGLVSVAIDLDPPLVEVCFHPTPVRPQRSKHRRAAVVNEMAGRAANVNTGGVPARARMTAYRQEALFIACCLERFGQLSPAQCRALGAAQKAGVILYSNHYGWFDRVDRGVYALNAQGRAALKDWDTVVKKLRKRIPRKMD